VLSVGSFCLSGWKVGFFFVIVVLWVGGYVFVRFDFCCSFLGGGLFLFGLECFALFFVMFCYGGCFIVCCFDAVLAVVCRLRFCIVVVLFSFFGLY